VLSAPEKRGNSETVPQDSKDRLAESLGSTRRRFYVGAVYGLWGIITGTLGASALAYLFIPPARRTNEEWVDAGEVAKLKPNLPVEVVFRRIRIDGWRVLSEKSSAWVTKSTEGTVTAFGPQCTHLGCAYHWDTGNEKFMCPCHSSVFSIQGEVQSGPAPRPLDRYETKIENGRLMLGRLRIAEANEA
jgi:menaquinol-cytochrome c reductase iron-sulfur subunit